MRTKQGLKWKVTSICAGVNASAGHVGRVAEADSRAGDGYARKEVRSEIDSKFRDTNSDLMKNWICTIKCIYIYVIINI